MRARSCSILTSGCGTWRGTRLAGAVHGDPADRMLIAMAQLDGVPLVTGDRLIIGYARAHRGTPLVDVRP